MPILLTVLVAVLVTISASLVTVFQFFVCELANIAISLVFWIFFGVRLTVARWLLALRRTDLV